MDWLPSELSLLSRSIDGEYETLYAIFKRDFIDSELYFEGCKVIYQTAIDHEAPGEYPKGFTHLITRKNGLHRVIDYDRAVRLPWVRAIIEHFNDPAVTILKTVKASPKYGLSNITYLWLKEKDFLVILSPVNHGELNGQMVITAYTITEYYTTKQLQQLEHKLLVQKLKKRPGDASID